MPFEATRRRENSQLKMTNAEGDMSNQAQDPDDKRKVLRFRHWGFIWCLDFDILS